MNCRFCGNALTHVFADLGMAPPSNSFLSVSQLEEEEQYYPLKIMVCGKCFLVQTDEFKKAEEIFSSEYVYYSSYSSSWLAHAKRYTEMMVDRFGFNRQSSIIEIASNDGYLLQYFKEKNIPVLGIEPTLGTANAARQKGIESINEFFGVALARRMATQNQFADLLIGNNVLAHVPDINDFVAGLKIILRETGVITMEFPHLLELIRHVQFDTIYHEHFSYLSFTTVKAIFKSHDLELFDVEEIPTHGGSLRIYAKHAGDSSKNVSARVDQLLEKEKEEGITSLEYYSGFQDAVEEIKRNFLEFLHAQKKSGKKVVAYGAAAKGNTLLNYCGVKNDLINFVVDASPVKQGKYMPGSRIPVVNEQELMMSRPDFIIILPWNIRDEIMNQLSYVRKWNCKFIIAIPKLQIV
jgi:SAM-dependent methyltransferase